MWFPKEQSNLITQMIAELNARLGGVYFKVAFEEGGLYTLVPTKLCIATKKYRYIPFEGGITFGEMHNYLDGILKGIRTQTK